MMLRAQYLIGKDNALSDEPILRVHTHLTTAQRLLFTLVSLVCYGLWYLVLTSANVPAEHRISTSLLLKQPSYAIGLVVIGIPLLSVLSSLAVGRVRFEAGLFCALIGLVVLPARGGDIRNTLLEAGSGAVFIRLAIESAALLGAIVATYFILLRLEPTRLLAPREPQTDKDPDTLGDRVTAVIAQAVCTLIIAMLLGQSPAKGQALATACVAGLLSSMMIHQTYAVRGSIWYVSGTMLGGIAAYLYCAYNPVGAQIGAVRGFASGAAQSLPLHYASLGAAGAIFGYWVSVIWRGAKLAKEAEAQTA